MPLTTRCSHCGRLFPVYAQQLKKRRGRVHCPQCGRRINALPGLIDEFVPGMAVEEGGRTTRRRRKPIATAPATLMTFDEPRRPIGRQHRALWAIGIVLLLAGLAAQALWWERGDWLKLPEVRDALERVCGHPACGLPLPRLVGTIEILQPVMAEDPQDPGVLRLDLTLINRSDLVQRLPVIQLELYDGSGGLTAARRLSPAVYRPQRPDESFGAGAAINLMLQLAAPSTPPSGFRIKLF